MQLANSRVCIYGTFVISQCAKYTHLHAYHKMMQRNHKNPLNNVSSMHIYRMQCAVAYQIGNTSYHTITEVKQH